MSVELVYEVTVCATGEEAQFQMIETQLSELVDKQSECPRVNIAKFKAVLTRDNSGYDIRDYVVSFRVKECAEKFDRDLTAIVTQAGCKIIVSEDR